MCYDKGNQEHRLDSALHLLYLSLSLRQPALLRHALQSIVDGGRPLWGSKVDSSNLMGMSFKIAGPHTLERPGLQKAMVPRIFARSNATHKYRAGYQAHDQRRAFLLAIVYTSGRIHGELLRMRITQMRPRRKLSSEG